MNPETTARALQVAVAALIGVTLLRWVAMMQGWVNLVGHLGWVLVATVVAFALVALLDWEARKGKPR